MVNALLLCRRLTGLWLIEPSRIDVFGCASVVRPLWGMLLSCRTGCRAAQSPAKPVRNDAIATATGVTPKLWRPPGGLTNAAVNEQAGKLGLAGILWDVIPYDWINDSNTVASRLLLMTQIKPGSVVLLHDAYSSTVDIVEQFIPVLKANNYHFVTITQLLGQRAPGSVYGSRENGPPANDLHDIPASEIPSLPNTPSPPPMPNFPITDVAGQNSGGPNNGS